MALHSLPGTKGNAVSWLALDNLYSRQIKHEGFIQGCLAVSGTTLPTEQSSFGLRNRPSCKLGTYKQGTMGTYKQGTMHDCVLALTSQLPVEYMRSQILEKSTVGLH